MGRKAVRVCAVILFLCGCGIFMYPAVSEKYAAYESNKVMEAFKKDLQRMAASVGNEEAEAGEGIEGAEELAKLYTDMKSYNERLNLEGQKNLKDPFSYEVPSFNLNAYGFRNNVIAIITIPKMKVELPVYLGANKGNMAKGAVILGETSMPTGGENTNVVIAAHRGYKGIKMFRDIELLKAGDEIQITTPWNTLYYEVAEISIVLPNEIDEVLIRQGKDMITLLTCHPYTENSHRYLVYANRVSTASESNSDTNPTEENAESEADSNNETGETNEGVSVVNKSEKRIWLETYLPYAGGIVVVILAIAGMIVTRKKDKKIN